MKEQINEMEKELRLVMAVGPKPREERSHQLARLLIKFGWVKQRKGKWKWISDDDVICSACGKVFYTADNADAGLSIWSFCPNCGAKMKGGE